MENIFKSKRRQAKGSQNCLHSLTFDDLTCENIHEEPKPSISGVNLNEILKKHFLFSALSNEELNLIISQMIFCKLRQNQFLFKQGSIARYFFILEKGELEVIIDNVKVKELNPGSYFGDLALLYNTERTASIRAAIDSCLWALDSTEFKAQLMALKKNQRTAAFDFVERMPVFSKLTSEQKDRLASEMLLEAYQDGQPIVAQGDDATAMFMIKSGKVEIIRDSKFVVFLEKGAYFGESAFSESGAKRTATVKAVGNVECFSVSRKALKQLFGQDVSMIVSMNEQRRLFASSEILQGFSEDQTEKLLRLLKTEHLDTDTVLFKTGEIPDKIILVMDGKLTDEHCVIGDELLLGKTPEFKEDIVAIQPTKICTLEVEKVFELFGKNLESLFERNSKFKYIMSNFHASRDLGQIDISTLKLCKRIGEGNFGLVYLVKENSNYFALKIIPKNRMSTVADVKCLISEKAALELVSFPKIVGLQSFLKTTNLVAFLSEYIEGIGFEKVLIELDIFNQSQAVFYSSQILLILQYLHLHGIVYRDLKPANLICKKNGYVKLVDMGTCKFLPKNKFGVFERTFTVVGTAHYMAPEIISAAGYTFSADYWSFGVMIFEMMCGYLPFGNDCEEPLAIYKEIIHKEPEFPEWFDDEISKDFIKKLLVKNPDARTGSSVWTLNTHDWFKEVDWHRILLENVDSPFQPQMNSALSMASVGAFDDCVKSINDLINQRYSLGDNGFTPDGKIISDVWENF